MIIEIGSTKGLFKSPLDPHGPFYWVAHKKYKYKHCNGNHQLIIQEILRNPSRVSCRSKNMPTVQVENG